MKILKIDQLGRVVIPIQYRRELGIRADDTLLFSMKEGAVMIQPARVACELCGSATDRERAVPLCDDCIAKIKKI